MDIIRESGREREIINSPNYDVTMYTVTNIFYYKYSGKHENCVEGSRNFFK